MGSDRPATANRERRGPTWSVGSFAAFWDKPDPAVVPAVLGPDVVGRWPGEDEPVRGPDAYTARLARLLELLPDLRLDVAESATNGEFTFIRWVMQATGLHGPFEITGIDRVRVRGGLVVENVITYDTAEFERLSGHPSYDPDRPPNGA
jgi:hypothetical protein